MTTFDIAMAVLTLAAVACLVWAVWEARAGAARPSSSTRSSRSIRPTYGPGYGLLGWEEEWAWTQVTRPFTWGHTRQVVAQMRKLQASMEALQRASLTGAQAMAKFKVEAEKLTKAGK